jgi:hypothetical protein
VYVADEADDERTRHVPSCGPEDAGFVDLEDFGLLIDDESERPPHGQDRQRFE